MKKNIGGRGGRILPGVLCGGLLALLIVLTLYMVYILNLGRSQPEFDFKEIASDSTSYAYDADLSRWFLPEFIGIFSGGEMKGLSGSASISAGIYRALAPALSGVICAENLADDVIDAGYWGRLASSECGVYLRYHSEVPDVVIGIFADDYYKSADSDRFEVEGGGRDRREVCSYVYEMYLIPVSGGAVEAAVRSWDGEVSLYRGGEFGEFTEDYVAELLSQYRRNMYDYRMTEAEPVFCQSVAARKILMTDKTTNLIQNSEEEEIKSLLGFFGLNTEKLLLSNVDEDGRGSYADANGILTVGESAFEFNSASDGGIGVDGFIGKSGEDGSVGLREYIEASVNIISYIRTMNRNYAGRDAEICFDSVEADGGVVTVKFFYAFDNIRITGAEPAFTAVFENGILRSARLYTMAVRNLGVRQMMIDEGKFIGYAGGGQEFRNTTLVYRSDFSAESVRSDWMGKR